MCVKEKERPCEFSRPREKTRKKRESVHRKVSVGRRYQVLLELSDELVLLGHVDLAGDFLATSPLLFAHLLDGE